MARKISGEFLKIENAGEDHLVWYVRENGDVNCFRMKGSRMSSQAKLAKMRIKSLESKLLITRNKKKNKSLKAQVEIEEMRIIWPQMYVAYCRGEDVGRFFTRHNRKPKKTQKLNVKYIPKHQIVKDGVNRLLESIRLEEPETTLEHAKRVYANETEDSYSNVNRLYHYRSKK